MLKRSIILSLLLVSTPVQATEIVFQFKNPSFSGINTGAQWLTVENQETLRKKAIQDKIEADLKAKALEEKNSIQHFLLEEADDMFYLFRNDTGEFFCQAPSLAELAKEVSTRNIDVAYVVSAAEGNDEAYWFRNGEIKTHTRTTAELKEHNK